MRSKTQSPCLHQAVVEIQGISFCEACAREQEAYFAIGELTQEGAQGFGSKPLADALERCGGSARGVRKGSKQSCIMGTLPQTR